MLAKSESKSNDRFLSSARAIIAPVKPDLADLTKFLKKQVKDFEVELQEMAAYCINHQGKRIRPVLLFLSGYTKDRAHKEELVKAAAVIELVHLATLVHDDVLDEATVRHNSMTISSRWGTAAAVLFGDALFAQALNLATEFSVVDVCRSVSLATRRVCAGEIHQTFERGNADFPLESYFRVIKLKTAELFRVACQLGAQLSGYSPDFVKAAAGFGEGLGISYQIYDDLADLVGDEDKIGKTLGTDIASGKFTIPIILLLNKLDKKSRKKLIEQLANGEIDNHAFSEKLAEADISKEVKAIFEDRLSQAENLLAPFDDTLQPKGFLLNISAYIRGSMQQLR